MDSIDYFLKVNKEDIYLICPYFEAFEGMVAIRTPKPTAGPFAIIKLMVAPDFKADFEDIFAIDFLDLKARGIKAIILDIDDTLIPRKHPAIPIRVFEWVANRKDEGFKICLTSNSRYPSRVASIGKALSLPYLFMGFKPLPFAFWKSMSLLASTPKTTVMIGDQLFTDIWGANLLGIYSIYVQPITPENHPHRVLMRYIERWLLSKIAHQTID
jgi:HAD superfamily phosphatase (TIGR01668 family)